MKIYCIREGGIIKTLFGCAQNDPQPEGYEEVEIKEGSPEVGGCIVDGVFIPAPQKDPQTPAVDAKLLCEVLITKGYITEKDLEPK